MEKPYVSVKQKKELSGLNFVLLYNETLNDWSFGKLVLFYFESRCFPRLCLGDVEVLWETTLFPSGSVIKCYTVLRLWIANVMGKVLCLLF